MFTGIVEAVGTVKEVAADRLTFETPEPFDAVREGDSIAANGVCLTVISLENRRFSANIMPETLRRTNLGGLRYNDHVNLERALSLGGRLGGHLVLGHIDDTGEVVSVTAEGAARIMRVSVPSRLMRYAVDKGFIAVDGVRLTIAALDSLSISVSLVAYTMEHTTLRERQPGDIVNVEADIIAKYVEGLHERRRQGLDSEFLREYGFPGGSDAG